LEKGFDKPLSTNIWDALGTSLQESAGVATFLGLLGIYMMK
jgi:hypothetical protein